MVIPFLNLFIIEIAQKVINPMTSAPPIYSITSRRTGGNLWLHQPGNANLLAREPQTIEYEICPDETTVGRAMFEELAQAAAAKTGDLVILLLGGRGAQALHRLLGELAQTAEIDELLSRLQVFTQDALAPLRPGNDFSFVRDFERLLGPAFFRKVKGFYSMPTDVADLAGALTAYCAKLQSLGGADIFFLGLGPEAEDAAHLCYIKPQAGAQAGDLAGVIPISPSILEHHIAKFKAGGSRASADDETACRRATHILTLGPAAILGARRIVQAIVDADTAPAKKACYRRFLDEEIASDLTLRAAQMDANPGLWLRLHPNVRSLILPNVLHTGA